jgi:uncharacterized protein YktA (UPF0223 family)|tara:strand:- start:324 stop:500 length:177 start_codon:yes stop_codon:yes gene_type:complete
MITAYTKVWNTIRTAQYVHLINGSVLNLINNFNKMYNDEVRYGELMEDYRAKLKNINE